MVDISIVSYQKLAVLLDTRHYKWVLLRTRLINRFRIHFNGLRRR